MCISLPRFGNFWISFLTFLLLGFHNANITCLMVPQNSHRLSSCLLIFLSFCSYDCIISNEPVFKLTNSFFCLIESALDALYCTFLSFIVFSALEFVWFLLFISLLNFSFYSYTVIYWLCWIVYMYSLEAHQTSLK